MEFNSMLLLIRDIANRMHSEAAALHSYIQNLEAALRAKQPDVDLASLRPPRNINISTPQEQRASSDKDGSLHDQELDIIEVDVDTNFTATNNTPRNLDTSRQERSQRTVQPPRRGEIAHNIGLIPLSAGVNKYVGPSSGFTLTKFIFNRAGRDNNMTFSLDADTSVNSESPSTTASRSMLAIQPGSLPASVTQAVHLSRIYFEHVHIQYPFLHEPTFFDLLSKKYEEPCYASKWATFQVTMVLAISASILAKRLPIPFSGESLCALAMRDLETIDVQSSLEGLQCILLVYMFTLHSPFSGINPWYLNYQLLATVLDFGLQRDLTLSDSISVFEREMRTRIFWVIYTIDRTLATILGRPIGLRDEGCDLRVCTTISRRGIC